MEPKAIWREATQVHLQELANESAQEYHSRVNGRCRELSGESKAAELIPFDELREEHKMARHASLHILTSQVNDRYEILKL